MSSLDITSLNATFTVTLPGVFNTPIPLENFAADRMWESEQRELVETQMSADGYYNVGRVANPVNQTVHLSAASDANAVFEAAVAFQDSDGAIIRLNGEIRLTATRRAYTLVNGVIRSSSSLPSAGRVLETRQWLLGWQSVLPAGF